jgi:hypothetical protein
LALLTLVLGVLAVTPELHAWLHGHAHGSAMSVAACGHAHDANHPSHADHDPVADSDAGCVVQLFAQGVDSGLAPSVSVPAPEGVVAETPRAPEALALAPTRYLRQPERGPPIA